MRSIGKTSWVGKVFRLPSSGSSEYLIVGEREDHISILIGEGEINYNFSKKAAAANFKAALWILLHD